MARGDPRGISSPGAARFLVTLRGQVESTLEKINIEGEHTAPPRPVVPERLRPGGVCETGGAWLSWLCHGRGSGTSQGALGSAALSPSLREGVQSRRQLPSGVGPQPVLAACSGSETQGPWALPGGAPRPTPPPGPGRLGAADADTQTKVQT